MLRFCKRCGTLYSDALGMCPKCNADAVTEQARKGETQTESADTNGIKRDWIGILVGIPLFIGFLYAITWFFKWLTAR